MKHNYIILTLILLFTMGCSANKVKTKIGVVKPVETYNAFYQMNGSLGSAERLYEANRDKFTQAEQKILETEWVRMSEMARALGRLISIKQGLTRPDEYLTDFQIYRNAALSYKNIRPVLFAKIDSLPDALQIDIRAFDKDINTMNNAMSQVSPNAKNEERMRIAIKVITQLAKMFLKYKLSK